MKKTKEGEAMMEKMEILLGRVLSDMKILGRDISPHFHRYHDLIKLNWKRYRKSKRNRTRYKWAEELHFWITEAYIDIYNYAENIKFYHGEEEYEMIYDQICKLKDVADIIAQREYTKVA